MNAVLAQPLRHEDIEGVYAGLRPLLQGESDATSQLSREHAVSQSVSGLITVAGGKYTTYRVMAKDVVDVAARGLDQKVPSAARRRRPSSARPATARTGTDARALAEETGLHVHVIERLLDRYGTRIHELLDADPRTTPSSAKPLEGAPTYLGGDPLRRLPRRRAASRRRTHPSDADLDRDLRPRHRSPPCPPRA